MTMTASLSVVGNPIINQKSTCVLTVSNSGAGVVNVTGIGTKALINGVPGYAPTASITFGQIFAAPGFSVPSSTLGMNELLVPVPAGGSTTFTFQVVAFGAAIQTGQLQQAAADYLIGADVQSDDGSSFSAPLVEYAPAFPQLGEPGAPPDVTPGHGALQFNIPANSAWTL